MRRFSCGILVLAVANLGLLGTLAADKPAQTIPGFGTVVDPDGDCRLAEGVKFTISVPNTLHDFAFQKEPGAQSKLNSPRLLEDVKGDFQIAIKVEAFPTPPTKANTNGRNCHRSVGLLIWQDEHNFLRFERVGSGGKPDPFVYLERFEDGQSTAKRKLSIDDKDICLRATRIGDKLALESSEDGQDWNKLTTLKTKLPEQLKVGVLAVNTSTTEFSPKIEIPPPNPGEAAAATRTGGDKPVPVVRTLSASVDPDGDCKFTAEPVVTITIPGTTHDLARMPSTKQNAPRVLDDIKGDFRLVLKVAAFPTPKPNTSSNNRISFVSAGALVWQDEKNFIRLERAAEGNGGSHFVLTACYLDGRETYSDSHNIDDTDTYLRVTRSGNSFTLETGADGGEWTKLKTLELKLPEQVKVGVAAVNTTISEFSATIEVPPTKDVDK